MSKRLENITVNDIGTETSIQYEVGEWCSVVKGPFFISTIIVANTSDSVDETDLQIRLADKRGDTLVMLEPKVIMTALTSDTFKNDSVFVGEGQILQIKPTISGINMFISGAGL